jgi:hypothetical protein
MLSGKYALACLALLFLSACLRAQQPVGNGKPDSAKPHAPLIVLADDNLSVLPVVQPDQKDLIDLLHSLMKKDSVDRKDTVIDTRNIHFGVLPAVGYTLQTRFAAIVSANAAFFTRQKGVPNQKLSSVQGSIAYTANKQIILPLLARIYFQGDRYTLISNYRYLKYPSLTYGLGGHTHIEDGYTIDFFYLKLHQALLRKMSKNFYFGFGYDFDYLWGIREVNPPPAHKTDFDKYGFHSTETASGPSFHLVYDSRQNSINPDYGQFLNIVYSPKFIFMGSDANWQSLHVEFRKYLSLDDRSRNLLSFWSYNWLTLDGKPPYLLLPSTGWDETYSTGRGYIQGRYRGRNMLYDELAYRFIVTDNGILGAVAFVNAESFSEPHSNCFEVIAPGAGLGIRLKLNKFSGTNLSIDYGFGKEGSKGLFVNFGEVF